MKCKLGSSRQPTSISATWYYALQSSDAGHGASSNLRLPIAAPGVLRKLRAKLISDPSSTPGSAKGYVITIRKTVGAGAFADTGQTVTILSSTANLQAECAAADVSFAAGDCVQVSVAPTGSPENAPGVSWEVEFEGTDAAESIWMASVQSPSTTVVGYMPGIGYQGAGQADAANSAFVSSVAGVISDLYGALGANPGSGGSGKSFTAQLQINGIDQVGAVLTWLETATAASVTGLNIAVAVGDIVTYKVTPSGTPNSPNNLNVGACFAPTTAGEFVIANTALPSGNALPAGTNYLGLAWRRYAQATESDAYGLLGDDVTLKAATIRVETAPGAGKTWAFNLRGGGADASTPYTTTFTNADAYPCVKTTTADFSPTLWTWYDTKAVGTSGIASSRVVASYVGYMASGDVTAPTITGRAIDAAGTSLTLTADEAISVGAGGNGGMVFTASGGAAGLTYSSGSGTASVVYTIDRAIQAGETVTLAYTQPGNGWEDAAGNDLASFSGAAVTNGSTQGGVSFQAAWARGSNVLL